MKHTESPPQDVSTTEERQFEGGLVRIEKLSEIVFPDPEKRPCLRSIRKWMAEGSVGYYKLGRSVYFDPVEFREDLRKFKVRAV